MLKTDSCHKSVSAQLPGKHTTANVENFLPKKLLYINKRYYLYQRLKRDRCKISYTYTSIHNTPSLTDRLP